MRSAVTGHRQRHSRQGNSRIFTENSLHACIVDGDCNPCRRRHLHELHAFCPALDHTVQGEADGRSPHDARVERRPVHQRAVVVNLTCRPATIGQTDGTAQGIQSGELRENCVCGGKMEKGSLYVIDTLRDIYCLHARTVSPKLPCVRLPVWHALHWPSSSPLYV